MPPNVYTSVPPTGGCVILNITPSEGLSPYLADILIKRYTGSLSETPQTIYAGINTPVFIDDGELLPAPLDRTATYYYSVTDTGGTYITSGVVPSADIVVNSNQLDRLIFRLLTSGINSLSLPEGFSKIQILQALPLTWGSERLPFLICNLDLEQQEAIGIGENVDSSVTNTWIIPTLVFKRYSLSILTLNPEERNFYKDAFISVFYGMQQALMQINSNISIHYQVTQTQSVADNQQPAFYIATGHLDFTANNNAIIQTNYSIIESITPLISSSTQQIVITI